MIPIKQASNCGSCEAHAHLPACLGQVASGSCPPLLEGPAPLLRTLAGALEADWAEQAQRPLAFDALTRSLRIADGEACLVLNVAAHCGGRLLADSAFHTLRRLLPNTDIYVRPAPDPHPAWEAASLG